jgi:hypothetical protein
MQYKQTLVFIYNAKSTIFDQLSDFAHKLISPETYQCNLCKLTYGNVQMKNDWKNFLDTLPYGKEFLYKDNLQEEYLSLSKKELPSVFLKSNNLITELISKSELNKIQDLSELKKTLTIKLGLSV